MTALVRQGGRRGVALLDETQRDAVLAYSRIAAASGGLLMVKDLAELLAIDATEEELQNSISSDESLASKVFVESGQVVLMGPGSDLATARKAIEEAERRKARAIANIKAARIFARLFSKDAIFVAVAGTNSYLSAAERDDIDFYCVTKTDGMWAFMLKSLILSRVFSVVWKDTPPFCFSFVMDEKKARSELSRSKGALYARDTLTAKVISGGGAYHRFLMNAAWMRPYFPAVYDHRLAEVNGDEDPHLSAGESTVVNMFLFLTLGSYVRLRAWVMNRKLAKQRKADAVFKTWIEPGRLEYAARRYVELGKMYRGLEALASPNS
jgi:hypothetical protein